MCNFITFELSSLDSAIPVQRFILKYVNNEDI